VSAPPATSRGTASFPFLRMDMFPLNRWSRTLAPLLITVVLLGGCAFYSFTGATIPGHINTIAVPLAIDRTSGPLPTLDESLTQQVITQFVNQTRLQLTSSEADADALLELRIEQYSNTPSAVGGDRAARNRVSLSVAVRYVDQVNDEELLDRSFSGSEEYDPIELGPAGEEEAARAVLDIIAQDIFTTATSNW